MTGRVVEEYEFTSLNSNRTVPAGVIADDDDLTTNLSPILAETAEERQAQIHSILTLISALTLCVGIVQVRTLFLTIKLHSLLLPNMYNLIKMLTHLIKISSINYTKIIHWNKTFALSDPFTHFFAKKSKNLYL